MKIGIIDYGAGNIKSVQFALNRCGVDYILSNQKNELEKCDKIIFPGVGHAKHAMQNLGATQMDIFLLQTSKPVLAICLGMQLMCKKTEEGNTECLNIFDAEVFKFNNENLKVPQIGWNSIEIINNPLFKNLDNYCFQYFVHSYYVEKNKHSIAHTNYGIEFCSAMHYKNYYAVQFHPEKSGDIGEKILSNFLAL